MMPRPCRRRGTALRTLAAALPPAAAAPASSARRLLDDAPSAPAVAPGPDLLAACRDPECPELREEPPSTFDVAFSTTAGEFTIRAFTPWAPPFARRFWALSRLRYMEGARFYRVDRSSDGQGWVVQFGYRGDPAVDQCWDRHRTSNSTWSVHAPGNVRGTVAFSMDAVNQSWTNPNCTADDYCAQGFSTNIYINYGNNSRLDPHGFAVFGVVLEPGMDIVNRLYAEYGEVSDLCPSGGSAQNYGGGGGGGFCHGFGSRCQGVNMTRLLSEGEEYCRREKPLLDRILHVGISENVIPGAVF